MKSEIPSVYVNSKSLDFSPIASIVRIYYSDSLLLLMVAKSEEQMFVYNLRDSKVTKFIKRGRGPGELIGAFYFGFLNNNKTTLVYDITQQKILKAKTDSLVYDNYFPDEVFDMPPIDGNLQCITGYKDIVLGLGTKDNARVVGIQESGSLMVMAKYSPEVIGNSLDENMILYSYSGIIKANVSRESCVIACRFADQLEIVDLNTGGPLFIKGPELFEPGTVVQKVRGGWALAHSNTERYAYTDVCCDDNYIYALYSGRTFNEGPASGRCIRVFSWDGEYLRNFTIDKDISAIDMIPGTNHFFGKSTLNEIVEYELPIYNQ